MSVVIAAVGLGKKYVLRHEQVERYPTMRDMLASKARKLAGTALQPFSNRKRAAASSVEEFWALRDVGFEVREGDRVGIIGRNGAGKSTLLKIISRITEPTTGRVKIRGRLASLLEVGTGFHPELTGRENIFLNGAILGMTKDEIRRKFDEIVAFAEVERFLDTPVKRYSSGMYVRLAFGVAAHLEPEILVVDEVLSVGDAKFQRKCIGKMETIGREGRTVLFVSHNMNAIEKLCTSAMLLDGGQVSLSSTNVRDVVKTYLFGSEGGRGRSQWSNERGEYARPQFTPRLMKVTDATGNDVEMPVKNDDAIWIQIEGYIDHPDAALQVGYAVYSEDGTMLYWSCHTDVAEERWDDLSKGDWVFRSKFPARMLNEGKYRLEMLVALYYREWLVEPGVRAPSIVIDIQGGLSDSPYWIVRRPGELAPVIEWDVSRAAL